MSQREDYFLVNERNFVRKNIQQRQNRWTALRAQENHESLEMLLPLYPNIGALNRSSGVMWCLLHLFCVRCLSSLSDSLRNLPEPILENQLGLRHRHELYLPPSPFPLFQLAPGVGLSCGSQRSAGTEWGQLGSTRSQQVTEKKPCSLAEFTGTTGSESG